MFPSVRSIGLVAPKLLLRPRPINEYRACIPLPDICQINDFLNILLKRDTGFARRTNDMRNEIWEHAS